MKEFLMRFAPLVTGILAGFDRLLFRGTLRALSAPEIMMSYLWANRVLLKDFRPHVEGVSTRIKNAADASVRKSGRRIVYLDSPGIRKEEVARKIAAEDKIQSGLIALLTCVETCYSYSIRRNPETKHLELKYGLRRCLHLYRYQFHPVFGFMHVRMQTWFPFMIHVCINGREWLARQMDHAGIGYVRRENGFTHIEDLAAAQKLFDAQVRASWPSLLNGLAREINPVHGEVFQKFPQDYYWSAHESEYATDVMFKTPQALASIYPALVKHAMLTFSSGDVMRFLGRRVPKSGQVDGRFNGDVTSDIKHRPEGVRVMHRVDRNSIKLYDKFGQILRAETTVNDPAVFKQFRRPEGQPQASKRWLPMRRGIADLHRRAKVSHASNDRYLRTLAAVENPDPLKTLADPVCRPVQWKKRRARALNPLALDDANLLKAVNHGEFKLNGFRNRDLRPLLFSANSSTPDESKRQSSAVTRKLRLLRAHGLIQKMTGTQRYKLTQKGERTISALLCAREASVKLLAKDVA